MVLFSGFFDFLSLGPWLWRTIPLLPYALPALKHNGASPHFTMKTVHLIATGVAPVEFEFDHVQR